MAWQLKNKRLQPSGTGAKSSNAPNTPLSGIAASSSSTGNQVHHLTNHLDTGDDLVRQFAASQIDTQKTAFMRWVNVQLATTTTYGPMNSIERDLRDGKRLIGLLEAISKEPLKPERGNMRIHQMANVSKAISFLEKRTDEPMGSIGNEDIVNGNVKLTLGLIWIIIYRFQIQTIANSIGDVYPSLIEEMNMEGEDSSNVVTAKGKKKGAQQVDAKQVLLRWVRNQLEDYSDIIPPIQDFHRSWRTGVAFAALIHRHDPNALPDFYTSILQNPHDTIDQWRSTLTRVFETALENMSLPQLLDAEDLVDVETPDERSVMTYVSEYYLVMSKHQQEQDPDIAEEQHTLRVQAKQGRVEIAGEDEQAALRMTLEEEERRKQEEQEELERIRLRRLEIEGWSIRAVERAREEEEARRKRKEEEEEKSRQRQLRREQRDREKALLLQKANGDKPRRKMSMADPSDIGAAELDVGYSRLESEPMDPEVLKARQVELDSKRELYHEETIAFLEWLEQQEVRFPDTPDTNVPMDRTMDLEPFKLAVGQAEEKRLIKAQEVTRLHSAREELLDYESPELTAEQIGDVDKVWWEIDAHWNTIGEKIIKAKVAIQELTWIVECTQEIDRILGDIQRFEDQFQATAEKRAQDSLQDRSQLTFLDHQETNLFSIRMLLRKYAEIMTTVLDSSAYTAPEHLIERKTQISSESLPQLNERLELVQQLLANDRLLRTFLDTFELSQERIQSTAHWLTSLGTPSFVSEDVWTSGNDLKEFLVRDRSHDYDLDQYLSEVNDLKSKLDEEQIKVVDFRSTELERLDQDAQAVIMAVEETHDATAENTTRSVQEMKQDVVGDLKRVEEMFPREAERCAYAMRVLDYLFAARSTLSDLETAYNAVSSWTATLPSSEVEAAVRRVEMSHGQLEATFKTAQDIQPFVWDSIQSRHGALSSLVKDLSSSFEEKQDIVRVDQQMRAFLDFTQACMMTIREIRSQLYADAPFNGFTSEDTTSLEQYSALVASVGKSFDEFENGTYVSYQEAASAMAASAGIAGSRQDPATVQTKLTNIQRLLGDVRALRLDRERDIVTLAECRRITKLFLTLNSDLGSLESKFANLEITDAEQKETLGDLVERSSQLANEHVLLEQSKVFRYITKDPSCLPMLKEIKERQSKIQQMQARLQAGLQVGEQWGILWDQFSDRVVTLEQYLNQTEQEILGRGIATIDGLADGDANWKKTEDELHEAEDANGRMVTNLKEFQRQRMLELSNLKVALYQSVQLSGGIETLDQIRTRQYHEAELHQQRLREHVQRLYLLNSKEGFQLEILGQRLVWSQQLTGSKVQLDSSTSACQNVVQEYAAWIAKSSAADGTEDLNKKPAEQLKQQVDQITATALTQKESMYDVTLAIYSSLAELATVAAPGETNTAPDSKKVPLHLEVELYEFKHRYTLLELHLEYARQMADHAGMVVDYIRKVDAMDSGFVRMATELRAVAEANPKTIEKLESIRKELEDLSEDIRTVVKMPKPSDKIAADAYPTGQQPSRTELEKVLRTRLERSRELSRGLDPLVIEFNALLAYQNGLRQLSDELNEHDRWVVRSGYKVQSVHDQIKQMFSSWPGDEQEQLKSQTHEAMVVFDVDEQVVVDDLDVLIAEMDKEFAYVQTQEQEFLKSKLKVEVALYNATAHSKQLQTMLEWQVDNLTRKIQMLETDIRSRSLNLQALEKRAIWEKEIEVARSWFKDFAKAVILFAREQVKWRSNHREFDDAASMRSVRTTASRMQIDRLGLSVIEFEDQVEIFETESRPRVDKAWSDLCSALVLIARQVPDEFQGRQNALGREFDEIRKQVSYSAQIVTQRKSLEEVALQLGELEGLETDLRSSAMSITSSRYGAGTKSIKTKEKGWSRFQAKVKKLTRK
ncbi:actinin alpha 2 [Dissophora globulifera]|uniref:Actinin alpha 2 n=1 Tax=Dissophora globulifera TaxID=979702 RepID=A0A9P6RCW9_9FUNG|nr:actinin alpha 2 [Dissophora globulifera]